LAKGLLALDAVLALLAFGCKAERRLTVDDCTALRAQIEGAWNRDAVAAQHLIGSDGHTRFIGEEQHRIGQAWQSRCSMLVGLRVSEREMSCLQKADTIDDVSECAR
jgi:hypothetical protein